MAGCILYCAFSIVNHSKAFSPPRFEPSSAAPRSISLRMSGLSWPARRAGSDAIVAGSCAGSPTRRHRRGRRAKAHMSSHSSACAASSTISASGAGVLAIAAWPRTRRAKAAAAADAACRTPTRTSSSNAAAAALGDEPFSPLTTGPRGCDRSSRARRDAPTRARPRWDSVARLLARRRATLRSPSGRPFRRRPGRQRRAASSQSASATARKSAAARFLSAP